MKNLCVVVVVAVAVAVDVLYRQLEIMQFLI